MKRSLCIGVSFGYACWLGAVASAQTKDTQASPSELSLEQLLNEKIPTVVGASRFVQQVIDAPATVTIVTHEEIERFGYRTLGEIIQSVRGFYVSYDRNYTFVGVRGFSRPGDYNSRVLLMVDGHRINDNIYESGFSGTEFPLDVDLIDRVEVVRGPSSSLYGTSAFFAVVDVITRKGSAAKPAAAIGLGSQNTHSGRVTFGRTYRNGTELLLSGSRYDSDGQRNVIINGTDGSVGMDEDRVWNVFGSVTHGNWSGEGLYSDRKKGIPTGAFATSLNDPRSETTDATGFLGLRYQGALRGTSVLWKTYYTRYTYEGVYASGFENPLFKDYAYGQWWTTEATLTRRLRAHLVTTGGEFRQNFQQDQGVYYDTNPREWELDDRRTSGVFGLFAQDELRLSPKVILSGGLRYDHWPSFGGTVNPRLAAIYKPQQTAALKLMHGTAFRAPNLYELYYYGDFSDTLDPERIRTTELAWEQFLPGQLRVTALGFHYRITNLISQVENASTLQGIGFANSGQMKADGFEWELEKTWRGGLQTLGAYTFTDAETADHEPLSNSPRHLGRARISAPIAGNRLVFGLESMYTSRRRTLSGDSTAGFDLANLTVTSHALRRGLVLSTTIGNLFNRSYADPGGEEQIGPSIPQDGRTARAKLRWHF
jgi:outer membrane receptor for ferrienterochelin and colicins